eukprot:CAMPEP_0178420102 /NCGR_PEP_ID=MMETSP0689_2-20121128/25956_1 /TAXON_ID=160604 /ORGANISM="Amphidinium massartii, Strain CS-259" /LENGTH=338 /DNA_ID=CAMNT_0020041567 /DNA_START=69 /DNA_END=1083 /DNA_ORIENTATION=+
MSRAGPDARQSKEASTSVSILLLLLSSLTAVLILNVVVAVTVALSHHIEWPVNGAEKPKPFLLGTHILAPSPSTEKSSELQGEEAGPSDVALTEWNRSAGCLPGLKPQDMDLFCVLKKHMTLHLVQPTPGLDLPVDFPDLLTRPRPRCAVVSSSGEMKGYTHGREIDAHRVVFRLNAAPTAGFMEQVGSKESVRFIEGLTQPTQAKLLAQLNGSSSTNDTHGSAKLQPKSPVLVITMRDKRRGAQQLLQQRSYARHIRVAFLLENSRKVRAFGEMAKILAAIYGHEGLGTPTTGAMAMITALSLCAVVDAYGMASPPAALTAPFHYYASGGDARTIDA